MSEQIDTLQATLRELESELAKLEESELQAETRAQLEQTVAKLQAALASPSPTLEHQSMVEQLTEAAETFRDSHPTLFAVIGRATDALARIGL